MHSKWFKVSTAIINFYLPLLVLICLNGRMYYEIKRRYKNVLLQRHANKLNDTSSNNHKLTSIRNNSQMGIYDSDRQLCSTAINYTENDNLIIPKQKTELRINFKEKKIRPPIISNNRKSSLKKHSYSFVKKNPYTEVNIQ
jgi:hypothetical protein